MCELEIFNDAGHFFVDAFKEMGIVPNVTSSNLYDEIATAQVKAILKYVKEQLNLLMSIRKKNKEHDFAEVLSSITYKGFVSLPPVEEPQKVI